VQTTWRATLGHALLATGTGITLLVAVVLVRVDQSAWIQGWLGLAVLCLLSGLTAAWLHFREADRFRRQLATGLTHHLRTSLAHIQSYNEMLLLGADRSEDERQQWLEVVGREAERLGAAVENLLLILATRKPEAYPVRRSVDLGALLEDVACGYSSPDAPKVRFDSGPPPGIIVDADPAALRHALGNLLRSIGRFGVPDGQLSAVLTSNGSTATILLGLSPGDGRFPPRLHGRNALREADLEGETGAGFGLEIAVVQHVARAHGGRAVPFHDQRRSGYRLDLPIARA
jgi:two-component system, OmpR family, phosphate regulon sensor histidine kinase PhoR